MSVKVTPKSTSVLKMIWSLAESGTLTITVKNPDEETATNSAITDWMDYAVEKEVFKKKNQLISEYKDAYIYKTNTVELE